jgi:DNA-binding transcriptional MerR regulator
MATPAAEVPRDELLHILHRHGFSVTEHMLLRWHDKGLLPQPRREGLGRGKGTRSYYPTWAIPQAATLALALDHTRNLQEAGWATWCLGYPVTPFARGVLLHFVQEKERELKKALDTMLRGDPRSAIRKAARPRDRRRVDPLQATLQTDSLEQVLTLAAKVLLGRVGDLPKATSVVWPWLGDAVEAQIGAKVYAELMPSRITEDERRKAMELIGRELSLPRIRVALERAPERDLEIIRGEASAAWMAGLHAEKIQPLLIPAVGYLLYFAVRVVSPTLAPEAERIARERGWSPPPPSPLQQVLQQGTMPSSAVKKTSKKRRK